MRGGQRRDDRIAPAYAGGGLIVRGFSPKEGCHRLYCLDFRR